MVEVSVIPIIYGVLGFFGTIGGIVLPIGFTFIEKQPKKGILFLPLSFLGPYLLYLFFTEGLNTTFVW